MKVNGYKIIADNSNTTLLELYNSTVEQGTTLKNREHHHTQFEISLFKSGSGEYTVGERVYRFRPGDVFIFSTHEQHCITRVDEGERMLLMNIQFEPRYIWSANNDLMDLKFLGIFFNRNEQFENRLDRDNPATVELCKLMLRMEEEFRQTRAEYELMVKVILLNILVNLMRDFSYTEKYKSYDVDSDSLVRIENAIEYIDNNITEEIKLEDVAKSANISRAYFCTVFKKLNGITVWDYITTKRIELAMRTIRNSNKTMLEVACECGFNNTANFNRAFKKITGITPSQYKRRK